jgi:hypothetical protein
VSFWHPTVFSFLTQIIAFKEYLKSKRHLTLVTRVQRGTLVRSRIQSVLVWSMIQCSPFSYFSSDRMPKLNWRTKTQISHILWTIHIYSLMDYCVKATLGNIVWQDLFITGNSQPRMDIFCLLLQTHSLQMFL